MKAFTHLTRISQSARRTAINSQVRLVRFEQDNQARARNVILASESWDALKTVASPDINSYNHLLWKITQNRGFDQTKYYYREMIDNNITPDVETFSIVLASALADRSLSRITYYLSEMVRQDVAPPSFFLSAAGSVFKANGQENFGRQFESLSTKPDAKELGELLETLNKVFR